MTQSHTHTFTHLHTLVHTHADSRTHSHTRPHGMRCAWVAPQTAPQLETPFCLRATLATLNLTPCNGRTQASECSEYCEYCTVSAAQHGTAPRQSCLTDDNDIIIIIVAARLRRVVVLLLLWLLLLLFSVASPHCGWGRGGEGRKVGKEDGQTGS